MLTIGHVIATAAQMGPLYAERLIKDIPATSFARLAAPGGKPIQSNHPAFIVGHLSLYPHRVMQLLEQPLDRVMIPAGYEGLFKSGVECRDDPNGSIYPSMTSLVEFFRQAYAAAIDAARSAPDESYAKPNPAEGRLRDLFPTIGEAVNFYIGGHMQMHLGQLSAWRRAIGMASA